ncbi:hypothetical protein [Enterobacter sp. PTB]|uniref:hypothetical protein n=1 Tax=Enterobacter sp. PTB TaxID=3143437 RepID=UPI003DA95CA2
MKFQYSVAGHNNPKTLIDSAVKMIMFYADQSGVLSNDVVRVFNETITESVNSKIPAFDAFGYLNEWIKTLAVREVRPNIDKLLSNLNAKDSLGKPMEFNEIIDDIEIVRKMNFISLNKSEITMLSAAVYLRGLGKLNQYNSVVSSLVDAVVKRNYLDYFCEQYCKTTSLLLSSPEHNFAQGASKVNGVKKRGPRNKNFNEAIRITELTLEKYPNVSTFSLANKLVKHFASLRDAPSVQTLRRWVDDYREVMIQIPNEPYTRAFVLVTEEIEGGKIKEQDKYISTDNLDDSSNSDSKADDRVLIDSFCDKTGLALTREEISALLNGETVEIGGGEAVRIRNGRIEPMGASRLPYW